ncbi:HAD family hydrolase [Brevibacillus fluminis]|uniref:HAD family hydrolase n=1 Tax=Brevibacillus fluminis TaxID=511487 RepID=UPI003F88E40D
MTFSHIKAVAFDMDGTLLDGRSELSQENRAACEALRASGRKILISTGRTYKSAQLPLDGFAFDGYVCSNGATVYEADGSMVHYHKLEAEAVIGILEKLHELPLYYEMHDIKSNRWIVKEDRQRMEEMIGEDELIEGINWRRFTFYTMTASASREELFARIRSGELEIVKIFIWHARPEALIGVRHELERWASKALITTSGPHNLEMIPPGVSKWEGLQYFCRKWELSAEEVMAFGDSDNDLEMLTYAGASVAMENSSATIERVAKFRAGNHIENGVAQFINQYIVK